jgi:hypothetical protein
MRTHKQKMRLSAMMHHAEAAADTRGVLPANESTLFVICHQGDVNCSSQFMSQF